MRGLLILVIACITPAYADDAGVYETLVGVSIGRVFLSPQERRLLDAQRKNGPPTASLAEPPADDVAEAEPPSNASGYIVSSSGKSRRWLDGNFVESQVTPTRNTRFPGDVQIIRHPAKEDQPEASGVEVSADD